MADGNSLANWDRYLAWLKWVQTKYPDAGALITQMSYQRWAEDGGPDPNSTNSQLVKQLEQYSKTPKQGQTPQTARAAQLNPDYVPPGLPNVIKTASGKTVPIIHWGVSQDEPWGMWVIADKTDPQGFRQATADEVSNPLGGAQFVPLGNQYYIPIPAAQDLTPEVLDAIESGWIYGADGMGGVANNGKPLDINMNLQTTDSLMGIGDSSLYYTYLAPQGVTKEEAASSPELDGMLTAWGQSLSLGNPLPAEFGKTLMDWTPKGKEARANQLKDWNNPQVNTESLKAQSSLDVIGQGNTRLVEGVTDPAVLEAAKLAGITEAELAANPRMQDAIGRAIGQTQPAVSLPAGAEGPPVPGVGVNSAQLTQELRTARTPEGGYQGQRIIYPGEEPQGGIRPDDIVVAGSEAEAATMGATSWIPATEWFGQKRNEVAQQHTGFIETQRGLGTRPSGQDPEQAGRFFALSQSYDPNIKVPLPAGVEGPPSSTPGIPNLNMSLPNAAQKTPAAAINPSTTTFGLDKLAEAQAKQQQEQLAMNEKWRKLVESARQKQQAAVNPQRMVKF